MIISSARSRIPWPLMHRYEADVRFIFDKCLGSVPVMHIPVDNENLPGVVPGPRIMRSNGDIAKETESHSPTPECVMSGRPHRAERPEIRSVHRAIDCIEYASRSSRRRIPRARAHEGIVVELRSARIRDSLYGYNVCRIVRER